MLTPGLPSLAHGASSRFGSGPVASSSSTSSFTAAGIHATATTPLSQPIDARHPLVQNCRECEAFSEDLLRLGTPSPGDSKMWVLYGELPALCRKVFGSRGTGPYDVVMLLRVSVLMSHIH